MDAEDGRRRTAAADIAMPKMFGPMNCNRTALRDAGPGSVGSFQFFGPDAADRIPPFGITGRGRLVEAMVDDDPIVIAQEDDIACRTGDPEKLIEFLPRGADDVLDSAPLVVHFVSAEDPRRIVRSWIDPEFDRRTLPRSGDRTPRFSAIIFDDGLDSIQMLVATLHKHRRTDFE